MLLPMPVCQIHHHAYADTLLRVLKQTGRKAMGMVLAAGRSRSMASSHLTGSAANATAASVGAFTRAATWAAAARAAGVTMAATAGAAVKVAAVIGGRTSC